MILRDVAGRFGLRQMVRSLHRVARVAASEAEVYRIGCATGDSDEALGQRSLCHNID